jgi:hypothetical protein
MFEGLMIVPIVNLNGDKRDVLLTELTDIREKLNAAIQALQNSQYVNGRNYQLNPAGEGREAYEQHSERVHTLERIAHELLEIQYEVSQQ